MMGYMTVITKNILYWGNGGAAQRFWPTLEAVVTGSSDFLLGKPKIRRSKSSFSLLVVFDGNF